MAPPLARLYPLLLFANKTQGREATDNFRQEKGSGGFPMPCECVALRVAFAPLFSTPVFQHAHVLLLGAMLSPGTAPRPRPCASWACAKTRSRSTPIGCCAVPAGLVSPPVRSCSACWSARLRQREQSCGDWRTPSSGDGASRSQRKASIVLRDALLLRTSSRRAASAAF